jgi:hypothetical protein
VPGELCLRPVPFLPKFSNTSRQGELDLDKRRFIWRQGKEIARVSYLPSRRFEFLSLVSFHD